MFESLTKLFTKIPPKPEENEGDPKYMLSYVLLETGTLDKEKIIKAVQADWNINLNDDLAGQPDTLKSKVGDCQLTIKLKPHPVEDGLPMEFSRYNMIWREASEVVSQHNAHLAILVKGDSHETMAEISEIVSMITASILKDPNSLCVYINMGVLEPKRYIGLANHYAESNSIPFNNFLAVNVYQNEDGTSGALCTGIQKFGQYDVEVVRSKEDPIRIHHILLTAAAYLLEHQELFVDGATFEIHLPNEDDPVNLKMDLSIGVTVTEPTFKLNIV